MKKITFKSGKELEIENISQSGENLMITTQTDNVNNLIEMFNDEGNAAVMRYYIGADLMQGYAGYTKLKEIQFVPGVVRNINYEVEDDTTKSGFAEETVDQCIVRMEKASPQAGTLETLVKTVSELQAGFQEINEIMEG